MLVISFIVGIRFSVDIGTLNVVSTAFLHLLDVERLIVVASMASSDDVTRSATMPIGMPWFSCQVIDPDRT